MVDASTQTGNASLRALVAEALRHVTLGVSVPGAAARGPQVVTLDVVQEAGEEPGHQEPQDSSQED